MAESYHADALARSACVREFAVPFACCFLCAGRNCPCTSVDTICIDVEKLEAEFGERLLRLGPKATASTLAALLAETVSGSATVAHPSSAARTAHVLIIAALNLVRVEVAPLPRPHDLPPLAFLLAQQQVRSKAIALQLKFSKRCISAAVLPIFINTARFVCPSNCVVEVARYLGFEDMVLAWIVFAAVPTLRGAIQSHASHSVLSLASNKLLVCRCQEVTVQMAPG